MFENYKGREGELKRERKYKVNRAWACVSDTECAKIKITFCVLMC